MNYNKLITLIRMGLFTVFMFVFFILIWTSSSGEAYTNDTTLENTNITTISTSSTEIKEKKIKKKKKEVKQIKTTEAKEDISNITNTNITYYTDSDIVNLAKILYRECRGVSSKTEQACVAWTICNRVDKYGNCSITDVITQPGQFASINGVPINDELYQLGLDVLKRWNSEKNGEIDVGRVLPKDYIYFSGDGTHNYFRNGYSGSFDVWDYTLKSPYST